MSKLPAFAELANVLAKRGSRRATCTLAACSTPRGVGEAKRRRAAADYERAQSVHAVAWTTRTDGVWLALECDASTIDGLARPPGGGAPCLEETTYCRSRCSSSSPALLPRLAGRSTPRHPGRWTRSGAYGATTRLAVRTDSPSAKRAVTATLFAAQAASGAAKTPTAPIAAPHRTPIAGASPTTISARRRSPRAGRTRSPARTWARRSAVEAATAAAPGRAGRIAAPRVRTAAIGARPTERPGAGDRRAVMA